MSGKDSCLSGYPGEKVVSLGRGSFARVDCYRRSTDKKLVAVKAYFGDGCNNVMFSREFSQLRKLLGKSHHICQIIADADDGATAEGSQIFNTQSIVMHLYPGGSLRKHIQQHFQGGMHISIARGYLAQLVSALGALESAGVIHRDIKTNNCLLDEHGNLMLCDFGCAVDISAGSAGTSASGRTYTIIGTPHAMAPEMVAASLGYGYSADYWSLGVFLYELLTGSIPPWERASVAAASTSRPVTATANGSQAAILTPPVVDRTSWPSREDSQMALLAIELPRSAGDCTHPSSSIAASTLGTGTEAYDSVKSSWFIEVVDELFVLKRRSGSGGAAYGLTERERGQYNSAVDLARCLLTVDPDQRLLRLRSAGGHRDTEQLSLDSQGALSWNAQVRRHPVFAGMDWQAVEDGTAPSPHPDFDRRLGCMELLHEYDNLHDVISDAQQDLFAGF